MPIPTDARSESSHLGKSFHFKGEISGSDDIFIDGEVEGTIQVPDQSVTIGPNGSLDANIQARDLMIHGKLKGNGHATDKIEVTRTGAVWGDLAMARISIQEGAFIQGRVDIHLPESKPAEFASSPTPPASFAAVASSGIGPAPLPEQGMLLDRK